jgi:hypothetical protein
MKQRRRPNEIPRCAADVRPSPPTTPPRESDPYRRITEALDEIGAGPIIEGGSTALKGIARRAKILAGIMRDREYLECPHSIVVWGKCAVCGREVAA